MISRVAAQPYHVTVTRRVERVLAAMLADETPSIPATNPDFADYFREMKVGRAKVHCE